MKKTSTPRWFGLSVLACAVAALLLQGCATSAATSTAEQGQTAEAATVAEGATVATVAAVAVEPPQPQDFPALDQLVWKQGAFASLESLRTMRTGMGKDQVRQLLGWPHFKTGLWGVREWDYIFHFRTDKSADFVTCQYMVRFDAAMLTQGLYWKNPDCALLLNPAAVAAPKLATPAPVHIPAFKPAQKVTLGADGLFRFDGGSLNDLLPEGRQRVEQLAQDLLRDFKTIDRIMVTGHSDRLGSEGYNQALSLARANAVRDLLVQQGIDAKLLRTLGMGENQPLTSCRGKVKSKALIDCLQPNRRVELEVAGDK